MTLLQVWTYSLGVFILCFEVQKELFGVPIEERCEIFKSKLVQHVLETNAKVEWQYGRNTHLR